jgi:hypothetical protein
MDVFQDITEQHGPSQSTWVRRDSWKELISRREVKLEGGEKKRNLSGRAAAETQRQLPLSSASKHLPKIATPTSK